MTRFLVIAVVVAIALAIFALVDVIFSDRDRVRGVPKGLWGFIVVFIPLAGPILWWSVGRPHKDSENSRHATGMGGASGSRGAGGTGRRPVAPDDDPDFLRGLGDPPGGSPRA